MIYRNMSAVAMAAAMLAAAVCFGAARAPAHDLMPTKKDQPPPDLRRFNPAHP